MSNNDEAMIIELEKLSDDLSLLLQGVEIQIYSLLPKIEDFIKQCTDILAQKEPKSPHAIRINVLLNGWNLILLNFDNKQSVIKVEHDESVLVAKVSRIGVIHRQFAKDVQPFLTNRKVGEAVDHRFQKPYKVYDDDDSAKDKKK
jgi:hypothetical protein